MASDKAPSYVYDSPISNAIGAPLASMAIEEDSYIELEQQAEERTASCMRSLGFEYHPVGLVPELVTEVSDLPWGSRAWMEVYGYGISTLAFHQNQVGAALVGFTDQPDLDSELLDPNGEVLSRLTPSELDAYLLALDGSPDSENQGCRGAAQRAVFVHEDREAAFMYAFEAELIELRARILSDPRIVAFESSVAKCVRGAGLEYRSHQWVESHFSERLSAFDDDSMFQSVFDSLGLDQDSMSIAARDEVLREYPLLPLSEMGLHLLAELQREEILLALAVDDCGGSVRKQETFLHDIVIELEQEFVQDNQVRLSAFLLEHPLDG